IFALAFGVLAFGYRRRTAIGSAYKALATLFLVGLGFVLAVFTLINLSGAEMVAASANAGYGFFPFALMALLGVFPLTLLECAAFGGPLLLLQGLAMAGHWNVLPWASPLHAFWLLGLIGTLAAMSSLSQLAFAIALVHQAMRDPLTRCFTRQSGLELLEIQLHQCRRTGAPLSLAFIDLDRFKRINDSFGHEAGDAALTAVGTAIKPLVRREDLLIRWGGEEFLLALPNTPMERAREVIERVRERGFGCGPDGKPITASVGMAEALSENIAEAAALIRLTDERMYMAKQRGRNCVVWNSLKVAAAAA
ncbi:MAG TPA: GGDEF domain-containing protein, partial [Rhodocyclaceae bacterium]|nr:GGDEF domain-containing protein [Rhodocyclaceae bacterium]